MKRMRKHLSAPSLLQLTRAHFSTIPDPLLSKTSYPLHDCLMSALAVFSLKYPSLLQFDHSYQEDEIVRHNLKTLYGINKAPSDTYMRERLDRVDPEVLHPAFKHCFEAVQRGKMLPLYTFLEGYYLISNDATGIFYSTQVHCEHCCVKQHRDGSQSYYHNLSCAVMVHPNQSTVLPMAVEPIRQADGQRKNDCEINASKRLLTRLRALYPKLPVVIVEDSLYSNGPHLQLLQSLKYKYIIGIKPSNHAWLFDWVNAGDCQTTTMTRDGYTLHFRWFNDAPLNETHENIRVNFFECKEITPKGKIRTFTWVTDFSITEQNVYALMRGARARWKVENETFNTLKTQGYHFEHNYGHGYQHLSTVLGSLMLLAFLIDQIQQLCCPQFQAALKKCKKRIRLWERLRHWFLTFYIDSWETFFTAIASPPKLRLTIDTG